MNCLLSMKLYLESCLLCFKSKSLLPKCIELMSFAVLLSARLTYCTGIYSNVYCFSLSFLFFCFVLTHLSHLQLLSLSCPSFTVLSHSLLFLPLSSPPSLYNVYRAWKVFFFPGIFHQGFFDPV